MRIRHATLYHLLSVYPTPSYKALNDSKSAHARLSYVVPGKLSLDKATLLGDVYPSNYWIPD